MIYSSLPLSSCRDSLPFSMSGFCVLCAAVIFYWHPDASRWLAVVTTSTWLSRLISWSGNVRIFNLDDGFWPLDPRRQSSLLRCWFRIKSLPWPVPCGSVLRESHVQLYINVPSLHESFGFLVASAMTELPVPSITACPYRLPRVGYWQFPDVSECSLIV